MRSKPFVNLFALMRLLALSVAQLYSNTPGGKALIFSNEYDQLAWPINKASDLTNAIWHGLHCVTQLKKVAGNERPEFSIVQPTNEQHHTKHCQQHIREIIKFFEANPDYTVHPIICNDLREMFKLYLHITVLPIGYGGYEVEDVVDKDGQLAQEAFRSFFQLHPEFVSNDEVFNALASINSGNIRIKAMNNYTLSLAEIRHLQEWESIRTNRLSALGLFCVLDDGKSAPVSLLTDLLQPPIKQK